MTNPSTKFDDARQPLFWSLPDAAALALLASLAVPFTWPLVRDFWTALGGDHGDGWQTAWGFWWIRFALSAGRSPFWTDLLHHPHGTPLVFQTFVFPEALWTWPFESVIAAHNAALLGTFVLSGAAMYGLGREVCGRRGPALVAGAAYAFAPYHLAHALGHLHLSAMHWPAFFAWAMLRALTTPRGVGLAAPLAGFFLAASAYASPYHLLACAAIALVWGPFLWLGAPPALFWGPHLSARARPPLRLLALRACAAGAVCLATLAPWLMALPRALALGPYHGAHDARFFSADLLAFLVPGARSLWSGWSSSMWSRFTGNSAENGVWLGWTLSVLALLGAARVRAARPLLALAALGVALSLGPDLHLGGAIRPAPLPWDALAKVLPVFRFSGVPVRLAFFATFALPLAAALGLARLSPRAHVLALALVLLEFWPLPLPTTQFSVPSPMHTWSRDPERFAIVDLSGDTRPLFHQTVHGRPMVGGYATRTLQRGEDWLKSTPVVRELFFPPPATSRLALARTDPTIDFDWGEGSPAPEVFPDEFEVRWTGVLRVPVTGLYELFLTSDDGARLWLDGAVIIDNSGQHPPQTRAARVDLAPGDHPLRLEYREQSGGALVRLEWRPPGGARAVVPAEALGGGLAGAYANLVAETGLGRERGRAALRALGVRHLVLPAQRRDLVVERDLALPLSWEGDGVRIYDVPPP